MTVIRLWPRGRPRHPDILTPAEWRVVAAFGHGASNAAIAAELGLSVNTVRTHISHILAKLDLPDRRALAAMQLEVPMTASNTAASLRCSFCRKSSDRVEFLIAGGAGDVHICSDCVRICNDVIAEQRSKAG